MTNLERVEAMCTAGSGLNDVDRAALLWLLRQNATFRDALDYVIHGPPCLTDARLAAKAALAPESAQPGDKGNS